MAANWESIYPVLSSPGLDWLLIQLQDYRAMCNLVIHIHTLAMTAGVCVVGYLCDCAPAYSVQSENWTLSSFFLSILKIILINTTFILAVLVILNHYYYYFYLALFGED